MLSVLLLLTAVGGYPYFKVLASPVYNSETMTLNYEVMGSGEKNMLVIHGLLGSRNYWKRGMEKIEETHSLYLVDLLGFGDSPKPQSDYSLDVQLEALEKVIIKEGLNDGQTVIVGHSLGAVLSIALFSKHPDWFSGAAVIALPIFTSKDQFRKDMLTHSFFDRLAVGPFGEVFCMLQPLYTIKLLKPKDMPDDVFADAKKHTWQSYYYSLNEVVLNTDLSYISKTIRDRKLLFIQGNKDRTAPLANAKKFAEPFTNATFIEVKNGDHQLFLKDPESVWNTIDRYFTQIHGNE